DDSPNAGFSATETKDLWLPLAPNYKEVNVVSEFEDPHSFLNYFRKLLAYRKSSSALKWGSYRSLDSGSAETQKNCFVFERRADGQRVIVALNFSAHDQPLKLNQLGAGKIVLSTTLDREGEINLSDFTLRANEGCIISP